MTILRPTRVHDLPNAHVDPALLRLLAHGARAADATLVVCAHPSSVPDGLCTPGALEAVRTRLEDLLGLPLDGLRGPSPGLLLRAARELGLDLRRLHELETGSRAGWRPAWSTPVARDLGDAARHLVHALRRSALIQVPAAIKPAIKRTTITQSTVDCPANKAPAIGHSLLPTIDLPTLDALARRRVLVIGEAMLDSYLAAHSERLHHQADPDEHITRLRAALEALGVPCGGLLRARARRIMPRQRPFASGQVLLLRRAGPGRMILSHDSFDILRRGHVAVAERTPVALLARADDSRVTLPAAPLVELPYPELLRATGILARRTADPGPKSVH